MRHHFIITLILFSVLSVSTMYGQTSAAFLEVNPDAAVQGLGGVTATASASAFSFWNNTAVTAVSDDRWQAGFSYGIWMPSKSNVISAGGYCRIGKVVSLSAGFKYFTFPSYDLFDESGQITGTASPGDFSLGVGAAFRIIDGLALSANISYWNSNLGFSNAKAGGVSLDFGAIYRFRKMRVGFVASNIGSKVNYGGSTSWNLPANIKAGFGGTLGTEKHSANLDVQTGLYFTGASFFASASAEYVYNRMLFVRTGFHYGDAKKYIPSYASLGLGFRWKWLKLDGAYLIPFTDSPLKNTFILNFSIAF